MEGERSKSAIALSGIRRHIWEIIGAIALLCGLWGLIELYRGRIKSIGGLPLAGWVVLFTGLMAFLAVMVQVADQQSAREEEQERQKRAVATAILFEIDYIYRYSVLDVENIFNRQGTSLDVALTRNKIVRLPFTVYEANAGVLGTLDQPLVENIVRLYGDFTTYLMTLNELALLAETRLQPYSKNPYYGVLVKRVEDTMLDLKQPIAEVSERLCKFTGVPRERIAALTSTTSTNAQTN